MPTTTKKKKKNYWRLTMRDHVFSQVEVADGGITLDEVYDQIESRPECIEHRMHRLRERVETAVDALVCNGKIYRHGDRFFLSAPEQEERRYGVSCPSCSYKATISPDDDTCPDCGEHGLDWMALGHEILEA